MEKLTPEQQKADHLQIMGKLMSTIAATIRRKPDPPLSFFDQLVKIIGDEHIAIFNGVTYGGERLDRDGCDEKIAFPTDKWFKIRIGKYISGPGDWGGGFEYSSCAVAEIYFDYYCNVLHVCAPDPFYNSRTLAKDEELHKKVLEKIEEIKIILANYDHVPLVTKDPWIRGVLNTLYAVVTEESDVWKRPMTINKPTKDPYD